MPTSSTTHTDAELVELARHGDLPAFLELLRRNDVRMRGLSYRLLADRQAMDDVLQDAYLKAYRGLAGFRPGADFDRWLYRLTYNACVDELRKRKTAAAVPSGDARAAARRGSTRAVGAAETVRAALAELPDDQRVTVVLVDGEGFAHHEVAKILGVANATVASRLHRARARLRQVLGEEVR